MPLYFVWLSDPGIQIACHYCVDLTPPDGRCREMRHRRDVRCATPCVVLTTGAMMTTTSSVAVPQVLGHNVDLYRHAVLHLLVCMDGPKWSLLFAFVELLPVEVPPPLHDGAISGPHLKKSNRRLFADHIPISVDRALTWYENARAGHAVRPNKDGSLPAPGITGTVECESLKWDDEPPWPSYVCAAGTHRLPFLYRWHGTPRLHHLMPTISPWSFSPEESAIVDTFMEAEFGFRRSAWPQLAGSIHLVAPNPYFREFHEGLRTGDERETLTPYLELRTQVSVPALQAHVTEHRPTGIGVVATVDVDATPRTATMTTEFYETSVRVDETSGGPVFVRGRTPFFRRFGIEMDVHHAKRQVSVSDSNGNVIETYVVSVGHRDIARGGAAPGVGAANALGTLMAEVEIRAMAKQLEQRWFAGDPEGAREFVRSQIAGAREQVMIADPFLGAIEIQRYALAVSLANVPVRLLTTGKGFDDVFTPAKVLENLERWNAEQPLLGPIELRVMEHVELHDRFLRVDNRIYTLGNSLNSLGDKASLLLRVPDPGPVFLELERIWEDADLLSDVAARRK